MWKYNVLEQIGVGENATWWIIRFNTLNKHHHRSRAHARDDRDLLHSMYGQLKLTVHGVAI